MWTYATAADQTASDTAMLFSVNGTSNEYFYFLWISDEKWSPNLYSDTWLWSITARDSCTITESNWHHVALVKIEDEYGLYVDGTQTGYFTDTDVLDTSGNFIIGGFVWFNNWYEGNIDEFIIHNTNYYNATPNTLKTDTIYVPTSAYDEETPSGHPGTKQVI